MTVINFFLPCSLREIFTIRVLVLCQLSCPCQGNKISDLRLLITRSDRLLCNLSATVTSNTVIRNKQCNLTVGDTSE